MTEPIVSRPHDSRAEQCVRTAPLSQGAASAGGRAVLGNSEPEVAARGGGELPSQELATAPKNAWLAAIRTRALEIAARPNIGPKYAADLRHIASDCTAAIDGCPASLESVEEYVAGDSDLDCVGTTASESTIPIVRAA